MANPRYGEWGDARTTAEPQDCLGQRHTRELTRAACDRVVQYPRTRPFSLLSLKPEPERLRSCSGGGGGEQHDRANDPRSSLSCPFPPTPWPMMLLTPPHLPFFLFWSLQKKQKAPASWRCGSCCTFSTIRWRAPVMQHDARTYTRYRQPHGRPFTVRFKCTCLQRKRRRLAAAAQRAPARPFDLPGIGSPYTAWRAPERRVCVSPRRSEGKERAPPRLSVG